MSDWNDNLAIVGTLPPTYKRIGPNFDIWQSSQLSVLSRFTEAFSSLTAQYSYTGANGGWLSAWGEIFGILRSTEYDALFKAAITGTLLAWRGTPAGIAQYINQIRNIPATVTENFPNVGWQLVINPTYTLTSAQVALLPTWLAFVRPAGVPYNVFVNNGSGVYLSTGNFLSATRFPGSWLRISGASPFGLSIPQTTNNTVCELPTTLLTDPLLNPSLSPVAL